MSKNSKVAVSGVEFNRLEGVFELHLKKGFTCQELISSVKDLLRQNPIKPKKYHIDVFFPDGIELDIELQNDPRNNWDLTLKCHINSFAEHVRLFESIPEMHKILFS
ncbi:hypothetical protein [Shimazuella alba]|uniref:Uncharacterized protein n=1 Tax=Shimazuella alba TaxID=2690964 RepID=A0A6I4W0G8_9BACL|nr:hypothetical protein [Shimazuella alba]MXQ53772.1 hypothetical protein [Shimazuella alba]